MTKPEFIAMLNAIITTNAAETYIKETFLAAIDLPEDECPESYYVSAINNVIDGCHDGAFLDDNISDTEMNAFLTKFPIESNLCNLDKFEADLIAFIKSHPYTVTQNANPEVAINQETGEPTIQLHTVNGEYERILIKLIYIA